MEESGYFMKNNELSNSAVCNLDYSFYDKVLFKEDNGKDADITYRILMLRSTS